MTVKDRIYSFIEYKGITVKKFEEMCSLSNGYISAMRKGFGGGKLNNVLTQFPELNRNWLLFGDGEMIKTNNQPEYITQSVESDARKFDVMEDRESTLKEMIAFMERQMNAQREMMDKHLSEQREKAERELAKENELHALMLKNQEEMLNQKSIELENKNLLIISLQEELKRQTEQLNEITAKHDESLKIREEQSAQLKELHEVNMKQSRSLSIMIDKLAEIENQNKKILHISRIGEERKAN